MTVDYFTYCCPKDIDRLMESFDEHWRSHGFDFNSLNIVFQRVNPQKGPNNYNCHIIEEKDYDTILLGNGINPDNKEAEHYTHGWNHAHYFKHHCVNHLVALENSTADYIVMSDADCHIQSQPRSWVTEGVNILKSDPSILVVSPSDGGGERKTQIMSQQLFICDRKRLQEIDFDLPFEGFYEGSPMQEYFFMLEGRIGRYMEKNNLYRHILDDQFRYYHKAWH